MKYLTRESKGVVVHKETSGDDFYTRDGEGGDEAWKLGVGAECNRLLKLADECKRNSYNPKMQQDEAAIRSIVARVAEFEELEAE
jgi:hypothetical protein